MRHVPLKVQITDTVYPVKVKKTVWVDGRKTSGSFSSSTGEIEIASGPRERMRWTLRHEIFHGAEAETSVETELLEKFGQEKTHEISELYATRVLPAALAAMESAGLIRILR